MFISYIIYFQLIVISFDYFHQRRLHHSSSQHYGMWMSEHSLFFIIFIMQTITLIIMYNYFHYLFPRKEGFKDCDFFVFRLCSRSMIVRFSKNWRKMKSFLPIITYRWKPFVSAAMLPHDNGWFNGASQFDDKTMCMLLCIIWMQIINSINSVGL